MIIRVVQKILGIMSIASGAVLLVLVIVWGDGNATAAAALSGIALLGAGSGAVLIWMSTNR
jgi:hypothetical protein